MQASNPMRRLAVAAALAVVGALPLLATAQGEYEQQLLSQQGSAVYAQIVIYDVQPGREAEFEKAVGLGPRASVSPDLINDRVMRNIDPANPQYATYSKFNSAGTAQSITAKRLAAVRPLLRREAEVHLAQLDKAYTPKGEFNAPSGRELPVSGVGQIAHLGLFLPSPSRVEEYYAALYKVKDHTVGRKPRGYIGDDLLIETQRNTPQTQAPYSPRAREATRLSFNYGEYKTLEDAEDSYVDRAQAQTPELVTLERIFYSALQVPNRFYIFKVIGNT